jgi:transposase
MFQASQGDRSIGNFFWPTEAQMARLEPHFPKILGKPHVDDRRVLSSIIFFNKNWLRCCDAPRKYGLPKTHYKREKQWSDKEFFARMMEGLTSEPLLRIL